MEQEPRRRGRRPAIPEEDRPVPRNLSLADVERITGLKIIDLKESAKYLTATLINGVRFSIPKW